MSPGSSTESYPAFARIGLRENSGKNLNQVTCPDRDSNPGHLVSRPDALTVTPQVWTVSSRVVASWSKAFCLGLALRNAHWFEFSWGKKFSHEISASVWGRCPPRIMMHLGRGGTIGSENPVSQISYNGWGDHRANHTIPPLWLDDRPPLFRHVDVSPATGWLVLALRRAPKRGAGPLARVTQGEPLGVRPAGWEREAHIFPSARDPPPPHDAPRRAAGVAPTLAFE
ncbi:hypothetical protein ANN_04622 [Periplaneta americana]|uniref:Uncharacterized protein n=1 Tax=Periplaneta americana TaxID=6978 RepID=A0ABQ8T912_PERAM|nr:hypothetical protein ANN_04622 [Periplaneta americana]